MGGHSTPAFLVLFVVVNDNDDGPYRLIPCMHGQDTQCQLHTCVGAILYDSCPGHTHTQDGSTRAHYSLLAKPGVHQCQCEQCT